MLDKTQLIEMLLESKVLAFGEFTLKSGRQSPYFFNLGHIFHSRALAEICKAYAILLEQDFPAAQCLFGPAYKGIPLASTTAVVAYQLFQWNLGVTFDRKEVKNHGEGGDLVGSPLVGNIVLIDDVITAGSAVRASLTKIKAAISPLDSPNGSSLGAQVQGLIVAMDRQESTVKGGPSSIQALATETGLKVSALLTFTDLLEYMLNKSEFAQHAEAMQRYRVEYGAPATG